MNVKVKCDDCGATCRTKGTEDWQSIGDGGPACCTGMEINPDGKEMEWEDDPTVNTVCLHTNFDVIESEQYDGGDD